MYDRNLDLSSGMLIAVLLRNSQYLMQAEAAASLHRQGLGSNLISVAFLLQAFGQLAGLSQSLVPHLTRGKGPRDP